VKGGGRSPSGRSSISSAVQTVSLPRDPLRTMLPMISWEKVIGSGCELNEALAHAGSLPGWSSLSIHSWTIAITASRSGAMNKVGRCFGNATKAIQSTPVWLSLI